ncbi:SDR family NAD(P)-dependent oxidoreductase [Nocardia salmonicida]|uniref:SDR family NAD(P)-dependent oxidoreductase n=1 Tax=Nocardia salmonicida TaxID=53431 RepID=UPI00372409CE
MSLPSPAADRTAIVTGASSGIGAALARELAARGHQVTLVARSADKLAELAAEITATGVRADILAADLGDRETRAALLGRVEGLGLAPSILVNCAGISTLGPVHKATPDAEIAMVELDVVAVVDLCTRFLPAMVARGTGAVLNVASTGAFQPLPGQAGYGASKAFVLSYTQSLSGELRGTGVTATVLCPGPVDTGFGERAGFTSEQAHAALPPVMWVSPEVVARVGISGLAKGTMVAIPGLANRAAAALVPFLPKRLLVPMLSRRHPGLR